MSYTARVLPVLIASPGDTQDARDAVEAVVQAWNRDRSVASKTVLQPLRWETDSVPLLGADAQSVINDQLVDQSDIVIAIFHTRLGRATPRAVSGTVEELERAQSRGARVHVYFDERPLPHDVDLEAVRTLREFRKELEKRGLLGTYSSLDDLAARVRTALESDTVQLVTPEAPVDEGGRQPGAAIRARYESRREPHTDSKGRIRYRTTGERLVVENVGDAVAEDIEIALTPVGSGDAPELLMGNTVERLLPQTAHRFPVVVHMGVAPEWRVDVRWREGMSRHEEYQIVSIF